MRIVQATLEHLDQLTPLFIKYRELFGQVAYPESSRKFLSTRISRKESVIYLAMPDDEERILGFCQLYPSYSSLSLKRVWILNDIYVAEDARRMLDGFIEELIHYHRHLQLSERFFHLVAVEILREWVL